MSKRRHINNWQSSNYKAGDFLIIKGSNETVEVIAHSKFKSGLAFRIESSGNVFSSASSLVSYLLRGKQISNGWSYIKKEDSYDYH